jgi:membrane-bound metal-dependent hydrolase YbcI (DUF457 family)
MPSPFAHIATGYFIYKSVNDKIPANSRRVGPVPIQLAILAAMSILPDIDALPGLLYGDMHGFHNNYTHSLISGLIVALIVAFLLTKIFKSGFLFWFPAVLASYELHILMDFFTSERGVKLFWPLYAERIVAPVKLFFGFKWDLELFSIWHLWTFITEAAFCFVLFLLFKLLQKSRRENAVLQVSTGDD